MNSINIINIIISIIIMNVIIIINIIISTIIIMIDLLQVKTTFLGLGAILQLSKHQLSKQCDNV